MTDTSPNTRLPAGLGQRHEIRGELGRGATGAVYPAGDTFAQRDVALKVAHAQIFNDDPEQMRVRKAWLNEVHLDGRPHHPFVVKIYDAGIGDKGAYRVMEYLAHGTLEPFTRPGNPKPVSEVLGIAYKRASALDYPCRAGIVHRGIQSANLQLVGPDAAKVCDFGSAYWSQGHTDATQAMDVGARACMAPELFRLGVTPQADIYAPGVALHQLLTGKREPPTSFRPDPPESLNTLLDKMLARSLEDRFANWPSVLSALSTHCRKAGRSPCLKRERHSANSPSPKKLPRREPQRSPPPAMESLARGPTKNSSLHRLGGDRKCCKSFSGLPPSASSRPMNATCDFTGGMPGPQTPVPELHDPIAP